MLKKTLPLLLISFVFAADAYAADYGRASGWCEQGGQKVVTPGSQQSTTYVQRSYTTGSQGCTVTVYLPGTTTLATIYSSATGTAKANPFAAASNGYWFFYANDGYFDVQISGAGLSGPVTLGGQPVFNPGSQYATPMQSPFNAKCDGVTNDATAIQAAEDYAYAAGKILFFPPGNCNISNVTIHKQESSNWMGSGMGNNTVSSTPGVCPTTITYSGSSAAIAVYSAQSPSIGDRHGTLQSMCIIGPGQMNTSIGLYMGGDPASVISPAASEAARLMFRDLRVAEFGTGLQHGNHFYINTFDNVYVQRNGLGMLSPSGTTNTGENVRWFGGLFADNLNGDMELNGTLNPRFYGTSFDYQFNPAVHSVAAKGTALVAEFHSCHFEKQYGPIFESTSGVFSVKMYGGHILASSVSSNGETGLVRAIGTGTTRFLAYGVDYFSNHAINYFIEATPTSSDTAINLDNLTGNQNGTVNAVSNLSSTFTGNGINFSIRGGDFFTGVNENTGKMTNLGRSVDVAPSPGVSVQETNHATSRRASYGLGLNWQIGQDSAANGTKDYFLFNQDAATTTFRQSEDGTKTAVGPTAGLDYTLTVDDRSAGGSTTQTIKQGAAQGTNYVLRIADAADNLFSGIMAGGRFQLPIVPFASLGTPVEGAVFKCSNCNVASPCTSGGTGAIVIGAAAAWNCPIAAP